MWDKTKSSGPAPQESAPAQSPTRGRSEFDQTAQQAAIGPSISVRGDVTGEEDLLILGEVEGKLELRKNRVTVGTGGKVKADIYAETVTVEGAVEGSLFGGEQVIIRKSGHVRGNITSPRVTLEDGAKFQGSIDMETKSEVRAVQPSPIASSVAAVIDTSEPAEEKKAGAGGKKL